MDRDGLLFLFLSLLKLCDLHIYLSMRCAHELVLINFIDVFLLDLFD
jgi:hypothetical protein